MDRHTDHLPQQATYITQVGAPAWACAYNDVMRATRGSEPERNHINAGVCFCPIGGCRVVMPHVRKVGSWTVLFNVMLFVKVAIWLYSSSLQQTYGVP